MKDPKDTKTLPLALPLKPGRVPSGRAKTAAQRKAEQVARTRTKVAAGSDEPLTDAECLYVLAASAWPAGSPIDHDAWLRLGRLRGYVS